jgi:hypothetical protein
MQFARLENQIIFYGSRILKKNIVEVPADMVRD